MTAMNSAAGGAGSSMNMLTMQPVETGNGLHSHGYNSGLNAWHAALGPEYQRLGNLQIARTGANAITVTALPV